MENLHKSEATWEREDDLWQFAKHIQNFKHESAMRTLRAYVGEDVVDRPSY